MSRYIETEKALNTLVDCVAGIIPIALAKHIIEHNSIADVQPVVRGEWKLAQGQKFIYECSNCGYVIAFTGVAETSEFSISDNPYNYCPNCGAEMSL